MSVEIESEKVAWRLDLKVRRNKSFKTAQSMRTQLTSPPFSPSFFVCTGTLPDSGKAKVLTYRAPPSEEKAAAEAVAGGGEDGKKEEEEGKAAARPGELSRAPTLL